MRGVRFVNVRVEVRNLAAAGPGRLSITRPDGSVAYAGALSASGARAGWVKRRLKLNLAQVGRWGLTYELGGSVVAEAPFDVVATDRRVVNRAPNSVTAALEPASPRAEVVVCRVATSLVTEDPDFEIVRYRYRWTSGGRLVRQVTTAALSDVIRNDATRPERATHLRRDAVRREASREPDGLGLRDAAGLKNGARPRPGPVRGRSTAFPGQLLGQSCVTGETGVPVLRLRGLGLGRRSLRRRLHQR